MRVAIGLAALLLAAAPAAAAPAAPAFTITRLDGSGHFDSRAHIGKHVLVVRFQASWCKVCVEEAGGIERVYRKYQPSGVELVSVQVQDTEADARQFLQAAKASYPAGLDPRLKIANRFGFRGTPYTVVTISPRRRGPSRAHPRSPREGGAREQAPRPPPVRPR